MDKKGFTLIEILVAISIVAVLAGISLFTYSLVRQSSRDQERAREITAIKQALEFYRHDQRNYPKTTGFPSSGTALYSPDGYKKYMDEIPVDPSSGQVYKYQAQPTSCDNDTTPCDSFIICAASERSGSFYPLQACGSLYCDIDGNTTFCNMGLSSD